MSRSTKGSSTSHTSGLEKAKGRVGVAVVILIAAGLILMAMLAACGSGSDESVEDGATLLETRCSVCHSTDQVKQAVKTRDEWDQTVARMIDNGAELTEAEKTVLVDYLTDTYGP